MYDNICRELKLILGASEVSLEASFAEDIVYVSSTGDRYVRENYYYGLGRGRDGGG